MKKMKITNKEWWSLSLLLPCIFVLCFFVWQLKADTSAMITLHSDDPVWDLRSVEMQKHYVRLKGDKVEYVPQALLTPEEFDNNPKAQVVKTEKAEETQYYTARFRILVPDGRVYGITFSSVDYADTIYINGQHMQDVGRPGTNSKETVPLTTTVYYTVVPDNGVIEVVHQVSNFVHKKGGNPVGLDIGSVESISRLCSRQTLTVAAIMGGCLILFIIHLVLFLQLRSYRTNLYFALFCLVWLVRTGVTGPKVITALFPEISWYLTFRLEYIAIPLASLLIILALDAMFEGIFRGGGKIFYRISECRGGTSIFFYTHCFNDSDTACCVRNGAVVRTICV
ncbi:MAG: 7TM diverse intracellular signaling domain-containing protein [Eubacteriales bacterium]|nr:7TM diverse intracellular signaling domain-containing protein [Eubacteriales bacterium]